MFSVEHLENIRAQKEGNANHPERKPMQTLLFIESNITLWCAKESLFSLSSGPHLHL